MTNAPGAGFARAAPGFLPRLHSAMLKMLADMGLEFVRDEPAPPAPARPLKQRKHRYSRQTFQIMVSDHAILRDMAKQAVWQEIGGRGAGWQGQTVPKGFKTQRELNEAGLGRTHWVGMPEWARGSGMNREQICAAVEKAIKGKRLGAKQLAILKAMLYELGDSRYSPAPAFDDVDAETPFRENPK